MSTFQSVLAMLGGLVVVLTAAARVPAAAAALMRDCLPLIAAVRELRAALATPAPAAPGAPRRGRPVISSRS